MSWTAVTSATSYKVQWKSGNQNYNTGNRQATVSNGTAHTITGLTNSTAYTIRVTATNGTGDGAPSTEATGTPAAVTLAASEVSASGATLTIGNYIDAWWYEGNQSGASCTSVAAGTLTATLSSLDAGTSYVYKAYSATGCDDDLLATAASFLTKPGKVSGVSAAARDEALAVSWTAVTSATSYKIQWKSGNQEFRHATNGQTTSTTTSKTLGSLTNATEYTVRVAAVNGTGDGAWSDDATGTPAGETLTVSEISATGATLTIANYGGDWYYKHTTPSSGQCSSKVSGLSATVSNLDSGTTHTFKAYSNSGCSTLVATASDFVTKPGKVAGVGAAARDEALAVTWTATTGAASYKIQWKSGNQEWDASNRQTTSTTASKTLSSLTNATEYTVRVAAVNASGDGAWSDTATGTPGGETLAASSVEATTAALTIGNYGGSWYYKHTVPSSGTCSSTAVSGATKDLTDLSSNTSYTYKAYSDSSCSTELATASAFLTKPGKPGKPVAALGAGSGKLTITASVTGDGTLSKWQYQQKSAGSFGDWQNISSTSKSLSHTVGSLTNGTSYQFKVRAVNATGNGAASDASTAIAPKDETLAASSVEATTATLTIGNWSGNWYYKYTSPSSGTCSSTAVSTASVDLDSLSSNTSYTFKAYSDSSCSTELAAASAFLTKPGKPGKPVAAVGAGTGKLTITASVTGDGTLSKWQYQQKSDGSFGSWKNISSTAKSLSHTVGSLTNGTSYQFKVRAVNATGTGAASDASDAKSPAAPTLAGSSVEATTATLTISNWTGDWYYKYTSPSSGSCSSKMTTSAKNLADLSGNTSYTFKAYSNSSCSTALATAAAFLTKPGKPTKPVASVGAGTGKLRITASVTGSGTLTEWEYQQKSDGSFGSWQDISSTDKSLSHIVSSLDDGTNYQFKVRAVNATGEGVASDASDAKAPAAVSLTASEVSASGAKLTIANHVGAWWYEGNQSGATCTSVGSGTTTATLSNLDAGTSYVYKAYSATGCNSTDLIATAASFLTKPAKPTGVTITTLSKKLKVSWTAVTSATSYKVQWKSGNQNYNTGNRQATVSNGTAHTITGLTNSTAYTIRVTATNGTGDGAPSTEATGTPAAVTLAASEVSASGATLDHRQLYRRLVVRGQPERR